MDYLGVAMLGAIFGFGLHAILSAGPRDDMESEIARLNQIIADKNIIADLDRQEEFEQTQRKVNRKAELRRIAREIKRGHGTPAGEA